VLVAGGCKLETRGKKCRLSAPKVVRDPTRKRFPFPVRLLLRTVGAKEYTDLSQSPPTQDRQEKRPKQLQLKAPKKCMRFSIFLTPEESTKGCHD
jgi:hypothetical protein